MAKISGAHMASLGHNELVNSKKYMNGDSRKVQNIHTKLEIGVTHSKSSHYQW